MDFDVQFALPSFVPGYYNLEDRVSDRKLYGVRDPGYHSRFC
jgi:hypothetical protein